MAKTQEELNAIKKEIETLNNKLTELTEEELKQVTGGTVGGTCDYWELGIPSRFVRLPTNCSTCAKLNFDEDSKSFYCEAGLTVTLW